MSHEETNMRARRAVRAVRGVSECVRRRQTHKTDNDTFEQAARLRSHCCQQRQGGGQASSERRVARPMDNSAEQSNCLR